VPFSDELQAWLEAPAKKTIADLTRVFEEKSFAIVFLLMMSLPALPIPTGGVTHVFEAITMLLALELVVGRDTIWLPKRWRQRELGALSTKRAIPFLVRRVRWFERFSRPRLPWLFDQRVVLSLIGAVVFVLALAAFVAPPFSGLDTLPSVGAVAIALSIILKDALILLIGLLVGSVGIGLEIALGSAVVHLL
jgi:hypothetical protein